MRIRHTGLEDLDRVMEIYAYAREFMARTGNPRQWGPTCWPPRELILSDIEHGKSYVCVEDYLPGETGQENAVPCERILGTFYYDCGKDIEPTYHMIVDGAWMDDSPYGVVHRIAAAEGTKGVGSFCINWAYDQSGHLRIDTHGDNKVMQGLLRKLGFLSCGTIYVVEDNDPRIAYEKVSAAPQPAEDSGKQCKDRD